MGKTPGRRLRSHAAAAAYRRRAATVLRIVYPGGRVELHDAPILAGEIMGRNPKCAVARPDVFRQPMAAVVSPETTLMLGQKFYVVPTSTVRKLQRKFAKQNPNLVAAAATSSPVLEGNNRSYVIGSGGGGPRRPKVGCFGCLSNLINGNHKGKFRDDRYYYSNDDYRMGVVRWSGSGSGSSSSSAGGGFGSPDGKVTVPKKRDFGLDSWTPSLESITEE